MKTKFKPEVEKKIIKLIAELKKAGMYVTLPQITAETQEVIYFGHNLPEITTKWKANIEIIIPDELIEIVK